MTTDEKIYNSCEFAVYLFLDRVNPHDAIIESLKEFMEEKPWVREHLLKICRKVKEQCPDKILTIKKVQGELGLYDDNLG